MSAGRFPIVLYLLDVETYGTRFQVQNVRPLILSGLALV